MRDDGITESFPWFVCLIDVQRRDTVCLDSFHQEEFGVSVLEFVSNFAAAAHFAGSLETVSWRQVVTVGVQVFVSWKF